MNVSLVDYTTLCPGWMESEMEIGKVEGVQHMAGTPLPHAVGVSFERGEYVFR